MAGTGMCSPNSLGPATNLISTFLLTMATVHCNISASTNFITDYGETALKNGLDDYDFVVIGAGSAGSVVAGRLAENMHNKVLLIEAGDDPPMESDIVGLWSQLLGSRVDWLYKTEPDPKSCGAMKTGFCFWNKGKMVGGSHAMGVRYHLRGSPHDYDLWEKAGNPSWGWNDIQYYFQKTEKFRGENPYESHGVRGPMNVESFPIPQFDQKMLKEAASELGHVLVDDFTDGPDIGFGKVYGTLRNGRGWTTAKSFLKKRRPNLHVIKNALAFKIDFSDDFIPKAQAVRFMYKKTQEMKVVARKEIILSAGSIETPKLLMLSGIGPSSHLHALGIPVINDLSVGNNLRDHVRVDMYLRYRFSHDKDLRKQFLDSIYNQWVNGKGPYSAAVLDISGFVASDGNRHLPVIHYMFRPFENPALDLAAYHDHIRESIIKQIDDTYRVIHVGVILTKPRSKGYLKLKSTDYRDDPLIRHNYFDQNDDLPRIFVGIQNLLKFESTTIFKKVDGQFLRVNIPECEYGSYKYWECYARYMSNTLYHYCGTTKMGPKTDEAAVVSPELEVYGVSGLRVVDAGIMPTLVRVNINAAVIMIAEKAADFIKKKWLR